MSIALFSIFHFLYAAKERLVFLFIYSIYLFVENEVSNQMKSVVLHQLFAFHAIFSMDILQVVTVYIHRTGATELLKQ